MRITTYTNSKKPELIKAVMLANMAECAYQDKDIREQYSDIKKEMPASANTEYGHQMM